MASLNRVHLIGNITREIEVKFTPKGQAVCEMGLAINRSFTKDGQKVEETTFVEVELWGRLAEIAGEYAKKGRSVFIEGRLRIEQWDDKQTGQKRSKLKVVGEGMQLLGSREEVQGERPQSRQQPTSRPSGPTVPEDDDIPF